MIRTLDPLYLNNFNICIKINGSVLFQNFCFRYLSHYETPKMITRFLFHNLRKIKISHQNCFFTVVDLCVKFTELDMVAKPQKQDQNDFWQPLWIQLRWQALIGFRPSLFLIADFAVSFIFHTLILRTRRNHFSIDKFGTRVSRASLEFINHNLFGYWVALDE